MHIEKTSQKEMSLRDDIVRLHNEVASHTWPVGLELKHDNIAYKILTTSTSRLYIASFLVIYDNEEFMVNYVYHESTQDATVFQNDYRVESSSLPPSDKTKQYVIAELVNHIENYTVLEFDWDAHDNYFTHPPFSHSGDPEHPEHPNVHEIIYM